MEAKCCRAMRKFFGCGVAMLRGVAGRGHALFLEMLIINEL